MSKDPISHDEVAELLRKQEREFKYELLYKQDEVGVLGQLFGVLFLVGFILLSFNSCSRINAVNNRVAALEASQTENE
jgi:hypothetical protein